MRCVILCLFLLSVPVHSGVAADSVTNPPIERDGNWPTATLEESGFDIDKMQWLNQRLESGEFSNLHMVLVEYDGRLVYEKYLSGDDQVWGVSVGHRQFDVSSLHDLRSVSKSVTSLLLGIALGDNFEDALKRPVIEYFPELAAQVAPGGEQVTLLQVLTMSAGFEWNEMDVPYSSHQNDARRMYYVSDPVRFALTRPLINEPGSSWYYNGGLTMVIAAVVEKVSGQPFLEFARDKLFIPLHLSSEFIDWRGRRIWRERLQMPSAASGLRLQARELARIGSLVLHEGRWQGRQIVPRGWIRASSIRHMEQTHSVWSQDGIYGYGYQWWHGQFNLPDSDFSAISGVGYGGQRLFVIPERNLVVTIFAGNYSSGKDNRRVSEKVLLEIVAAAP